MKNYILFLTFLLVGCYTEPINSTRLNNTRSDSLAIIDTGYIDPISKHIKPPCSISPDYCGCMESRIKASNIQIVFNCNP
jgi:PBP1b-binding outer membrane lipoprotein LpoB